MNIDVSYDDLPSIVKREPNTAVREPEVFTPEHIGGWLFIIDSVSIVCAFILAHITFLLLHHNTESQHTVTSLVGSAVILLTMMQCGLYSFTTTQNRAREVKLIATAITLSFLFILAMSFTYSELRFSRTWYIGWYIYTLSLVTGARFAAWRRFQHLVGNGRLKRRIAVYGSGEQASRLIEVLRQRGKQWIEIVGIFDDRAKPRGDMRQEATATRGVKDLIGLCRQGKVDELIVALPWSAERRLVYLMSQFENVPTHIRMAPDLAAFSFPRVEHCNVYGLSFLSAENRRHSGFWMPIKVLEDYVLASVLVLLFAPLMAVIALAVKLSSPGPVIYKQDRHGLNNRTFKIFKFRSMVVQSEPTSMTIQATRGDPRVTVVGRFLRKTSLDELPQLFNILRGEMSLVGPRPHAADHNELHGSTIGRYFARHKVKPGMTGWAQVHGLRGEIDKPEKMQQRIQYDLDYIENWSIMLDFVILTRTAFVVLFQKTAF
jgi:Undecaprenyl-phosphate glucose phosphotransferase